MGRKKLPAVAVQSEFIPFIGGSDFVSPMLQVKPNFAREAQNYEIDINGGYRRIAGYERFDGRSSPSAQTYSILPVTITGTVAVGNVLTDNATTSFGTVIALPAGGTQVVLTLMTGHFTAGNIKVGGVTVGTCSGAEVQDSASTPKLHAQYKALAANVYRALISAVPGSGPIRGVWLYNDVVYAFRDNIGATVCVMYKSTTSGWTAVTLGEEVSFTNAAGNVVDAVTLTQGGVTATVSRVVLQTGSLASGVNTGRLIITGRGGGNFAAGAATTSGGGTLTLSGVQTAISFAVPGGRFEFVTTNFSGSTASRRMYGVDGKNRAFEFDGTTLVPIATGMTLDTPTHVVEHKKQLFLSYGPLAQHSQPGNPYVWNVVTGAGAIAMGDDVTGFSQLPGGANAAALVIVTRNGLAVLYGSGITDWDLVPYDQEAGGYAYSIQHIGRTFMLDDRGITDVATTQQFGNFISATWSKLVQPWLVTRHALVTASSISREKNQYRLFFSDGSALYMTIDNGELVGLMPMQLTHLPTCLVSRETSTGTEAIYFGDTTGYVFQMEKGTSFDGSDIEAYLNLVFDNSSSPLQLKTFRGALFECEGDGYAEFTFSYELGYASTELEQPGTQTAVNSLTPAVWDSFTWDSFYWDGRSLSPAMVDFIGTAENFSFRFRSLGDYFAPLRISGALFHYTPRSRVRLAS
jgi:hypothetical protein